MQGTGPAVLRSLLATIVAITLLLTTGVACPLPAHAQDHEPLPTPSAPPSATPSSPSADLRTDEPAGGGPGDWISERFQDALAATIKGVTHPFEALISSQWSRRDGFLVSTGPEVSYNSPTVLQLWSLLRAVANASLAVILLWGGLNVMLRHQLGFEYQGAMELLPRLVLGAVMANFSIYWARILIDLNNALCEAVALVRPPGWDQASAITQGLAGLILWLVIVVMLVLLVVAMLMRLALVDLLIVLSPLALVCWILPQTQEYARRWSTAFTAAVFTQFLQVLALRLAVSIMGSSGLTAGQALTEALASIAALALVFSVPRLLHQRPGGPALSFLMLAAVRGIARGHGSSGHVPSASGSTAPVAGTTATSYRPGISSTTASTSPSTAGEEAAG